MNILEIIKEIKSNKEIEFKIGITILPIFLTTIMPLFFYIIYLATEYEILKAFAFTSILYYPNVILHELAHASIHKKYGGFRGYIYICTNKKKRKLTVKTNSYVFKTGSYSYTKKQMKEMLLEPIKYSCIFILINVCVLLTYFDSLRRIFQTGLFNFMMVLISFLLYNIAIYLLGSINDCKMVKKMSKIDDINVIEIIDKKTNDFDIKPASSKS